MLKYALIGCGRISPNHLEAAKKYPDELEIVGICDVDKKNMSELLECTNSVGYKEYIDYKEMIKTEKPGLVAIATESGYHHEIAMFCIENGCNLIIEKPIALSIKDADEIIAAAEKYGVLVSACHQNRFNKSILKLKETMDEGKFGRLFHGNASIRWFRGESYYSQAKWRGTWALDGGALMNQCIHNIDLLRFLMGGEISEVFAYTARLSHPYIEAEDLGVALIKFKNGSYGVIEGTTNVYPQNLEETLTLFGSTGTVKVGGKSVNKIEYWAFPDTKENVEELMEKNSEMPENVYGFGHSKLYKNVIDALKNGTEPAITAKDGKNALELILAIYKSAAEGRPVKLPLTECASTDFIGRFDKK